MELLIRSQDKLDFKKYNDIIEVRFIKNNICYKDGWAIFIDKRIMGVYKTKERTLEVLDEIQEKITQFNVKTDYGCVSNIYEMPNE